MKGSSLIIANGLYRSGSTWQYNVIQQLLERCVAGRGLGLYDPDGLRKAMLDTVKHQCHCVVKIHSYIEGVQYLLRNDVAKLVYIYRDLRDVYMSLQKYQGHTEYFESGGRIRYDLRGYYKMRSEPNTFFQRYEDMMGDPLAATRQLATFLGLKVDPDVVRQIAGICSTSQARLIAEHQHEGQHDPRTLVYHNHVSATEGRSTWREELDPAIAEELTVRFKDWLQHAGYETEEKQ